MVVHDTRRGRIYVGAKWKEPAVSPMPWSTNRRPSAAGLCVKGRKTALLGYTGAEQGGKSPKDFCHSHKTVSDGLGKAISEGLTGKWSPYGDMSA